MNYKRDYNIKDNEIRAIKNYETSIKDRKVSIKYRKLNPEEIIMSTIANDIIAYADDCLDQFLDDVAYSGNDTISEIYCPYSPYVDLTEEEYRNLLKSFDNNPNTGFYYLRQQLKNYLLQTLLTQIAIINDYADLDEIKQQVRENAETDSCDSDADKESPHNLTSQETNTLLQDTYAYYSLMKQPDKLEHAPFKVQLDLYLKERRKLRTSAKRKGNRVSKNVKTQLLDSQKYQSFSSKPWLPEYSFAEHIKSFQYYYNAEFDYQRFLHADFVFGYLTQIDSGAMIPECLGLYVNFVAENLEKNSQNLYKRCFVYKNSPNRSEDDRFERMISRYQEYISIGNSLIKSLDKTFCSNAELICNNFLINNTLLAKHFFNSINSNLFKYLSDATDIDWLVNADTTYLTAGELHMSYNKIFALNLLKYLMFFDIDLAKLEKHPFWGIYSDLPNTKLLRMYEIDNDIHLPLHYIFKLLVRVASKKGNFLSKALKKYFDALDQGLDRASMTEILATAIKKEIETNEPIQPLKNTALYREYSKSDEMLLADLLSYPSTYAYFNVTK